MPRITSPCTENATEAATQVLDSGPGGPPALSRGVESLLIVGAFASITLCITLLVMALVFFCKPERLRDAFRRPCQDVQLSSSGPRSKEESAQKPSRPTSAAASSHRTSQKSAKRIHVKQNFAVRPYTIQSPLPADDDQPYIRMSHPAGQETGSALVEAFRTEVEPDNRSSVDAVVALDLDERGSEDTRSVRARHSTRTSLDERRYAKLEKFMRIPPSEWYNRSSSHS